MNTRLGVIVDALVSTWTTAGLTVNDGPPRRGQDVGTAVIYVGWDGNESGEGGLAPQEWAGLGNRARNERPEVTCYVEYTTGDTVMKTARDGALTALEAAETALRADPTLGGALTGAQWASLGGIDRYVPSQTDAGARVGIQFTVAAFARI